MPVMSLFSGQWENRARGAIAARAQNSQSVWDPSLSRLYASHMQGLFMSSCLLAILLGHQSSADSIVASLPVSLNRPPVMEILATWVSLDKQAELGEHFPY